MDTYVVPSDVTTLGGDPVDWKAELPDGNGEVFLFVLRSLLCLLSLSLISLP